MEISTRKGTPLPLGATICPQGVNFSVASSASKSLKLNIFELSNSTDLISVASVLLDPLYHRTGKVWHVYVEGIKPYMLYAFENQKGDHLLDPYSKEVFAQKSWGADAPYVPYGVILDPMNFDWENDLPPSLPLSELIIYEMHIRGFTQDPSSKSSHPGSYLGVIEKIPYLKQLGVNAVEILPVHEFNEMETAYLIQGKDLRNFWGYSPLNFFSPMARYASESTPGSPTKEFKTMVKEFHKNGIEVILDVVFNHTGEGNGKGRTYSFRGLYPKAYYMIDDHHEYLNFSGCGNTLNANHPVTLDLIIDVLRYMVSEMHVDGFRFDLASTLTRGKRGTPLIHPPVIQAINGDPILSNIKLIAEPWDCGLYHVGNFPEHQDNWAEWNGKYRDSVRNFIKGTAYKGEFTTRLCGSQDLYGANRKPYHSINFITAHDGFTLSDLVSYNTKHNEQNKEGNKDGTNDHFSWNCGKEGPATNPKILELRLRQRRNFMLALLISQGVPMIQMGDEYGQTKLGNNNTWCQDIRLSWFQWDQLPSNQSFLDYVSFLIDFRKKHPTLHRETFLTDNEIQWHGFSPNSPDWDDGIPFTSFTYLDHEQKHLYAAFNADYRKHQVNFPNPPEGKSWHWIINTASEQGYFSEPKQITYGKTIMVPYSSILLQAL